LNLRILKTVFIVENSLFEFLWWLHFAGELASGKVKRQIYLGFYVPKIIQIGSFFTQVI